MAILSKFVLFSGGVTRAEGKDEGTGGYLGLECIL